MTRRDPWVGRSHGLSPGVQRFGEFLGRLIGEIETEHEYLLEHGQPGLAEQLDVLQDVASQLLEDVMHEVMEEGTDEYEGIDIHDAFASAYQRYIEPDPWHGLDREALVKVLRTELLSSLTLSWDEIQALDDEELIEDARQEYERKRRRR